MLGFSDKHESVHRYQDVKILCNFQKSTDAIHGVFYTIHTPKYQMDVDKFAETEEIVFSKMQTMLVYFYNKVVRVEIVTQV